MTIRSYTRIQLPSLFIVTIGCWCILGSNVVEESCVNAFINPLMVLINSTRDYTTNSTQSISLTCRNESHGRGKATCDTSSNWIYDFSCECSGLPTGLYLCKNTSARQFKVDVGTRLDNICCENPNPNVQTTYHPPKPDFITCMPNGVWSKTDCQAVDLLALWICLGIIGCLVFVFFVWIFFNKSKVQDKPY